MDFEKAYKKFLDGTATAEETEFVRSEMKKANEVNSILNGTKTENITNTAERETVKKAMRSYWKKDTLKILIIVCSVVLVLAIAVTLAITIPIFNNAKNNTNYTAKQAEAIAVEHISGRFPSCEVYRVDRELEVEGRIKHARYIYVVDVYNGVNEVLEIEVDGKTGNIIDVD